MNFKRYATAQRKVRNKSQDDFKKINSDFLITEANHILELEIIFKNNEWIIYSLK